MLLLLQQEALHGQQTWLTETITSGGALLQQEAGVKIFGRDRRISRLFAQLRRKHAVVRTRERPRAVRHVRCGEDSALRVVRFLEELHRRRIPVREEAADEERVFTDGLRERIKVLVVA